MHSSNLLSKYRKEILSAILGALLTGIISLSAGLYSLTKSFELTQKQDILFRLRVDINLLKKTEKELDQNMAFLLTQSFLPSVEVEKLSYPTMEKVTDEKQKEIMQFYQEYQRTILGDPYKISKATIPKDLFVLTCWPYGGPTVTEIDFDLVQGLNELYRKLSQVNRSIDEIRYISKNNILFRRDVEQVNELTDSISNDIVEITQEKILRLKNKIAIEINGLQSEREKILD